MGFGWITKTTKIIRSEWNFVSVPWAKYSTQAAVNWTLPRRQPASLPRSARAYALACSSACSLVRDAANGLGQLNLFEAEGGRRPVVGIASRAVKRHREVSDASRLAFVLLSPCKKLLWTCVLDHTAVVVAVR